MAPMVNTPELRFQVDESRKFAIVDEVLARLAASGAKVDRTDGARVLTGDGWWLLRASNTQDVLVARAEAKDAAGLDRLVAAIDDQLRSEEHTSELQSLMRSSYAVFCLNKKKQTKRRDHYHT